MCVILHHNQKIINMEEKKKKAPKTFCDVSCGWYKIVESPDFQKPDGKGIMELCSYGDGCRSFGCLNACPKKFGE